MKIRFDAMANNIEWAFQPAQQQIELKVGENGMAFYRATNLSDKPLTGTATFNVTPLKVGPISAKSNAFVSLNKHSSRARQWKCLSHSSSTLKSQMIQT